MRGKSREMNPSRFNRVQIGFDRGRTRKDTTVCGFLSPRELKDVRTVSDNSPNADKIVNQRRVDTIHSVCFSNRKKAEHVHDK